MANVKDAENPRTTPEAGRDACAGL